MLTDMERKVLTIIQNSFHNRRQPTIKGLSIRGGLSLKGIKQVLGSLAGKGYIKWDPEEPDKIPLCQTIEQRNQALPCCWKC